MTVFDVEIVSSLLDKWIELVVANEVKELDFHLRANKNRMYSLPGTIFSAEFLTTLKLCGCNLEQSSAYTISIEIVAPSLQQCTLACVQMSCVIDMVRCADLKYFSLISAGILDQEFHNLISKFPLLEKLTMYGCILERVSLSNNQLKELQVFHCPRLRVIDIDIPSLLTFFYEFFGNPARSINAPRTCSWKVRISLHCDGYDVLISLDSIKKFLEVPYDIEELSISISIQDMDSYALDKFKKRSPSLPCKVVNLAIDVLDLQPSNYAALLD
ncbi:hypothetical protein QYF36_015833 [Acer negundo]|nr:hypothetical protein QYF36_015833 [Acer negundo]